MTLVMFVSWIVVAAATGWAAGAVMTYGGHGRKTDMFLALGGAGLVCSVAAAMDLFAGSHFWVPALVAFFSASGAITAQRLFFSVPPAPPPPRSRRR